MTHRILVDVENGSCWRGEDGQLSISEVKDSISCHNKTAGCFTNLALLLFKWRCCIFPSGMLKWKGAILCEWIDVHFEMLPDSVGLSCTCKEKNQPWAFFWTQHFPDNSLPFFMLLFLFSQTVLVRNGNSSGDAFYSTSNLCEKSLLGLPLIWGQLSWVGDGSVASVERKLKLSVLARYQTVKWTSCLHIRASERFILVSVSAEIKTPVD